MLSAKIIYLIHLTYSDLNKSGSNQVDLNHDGSNHVTANQSESNNVRFDPVSWTSKNQISDSDFDFLHDVLPRGSSTPATRK